MVLREALLDLLGTDRPEFGSVGLEHRLGEHCCSPGERFYSNIQHFVAVMISTPGYGPLVSWLCHTILRYSGQVVDYASLAD